MKKTHPEGSSGGRCARERVITKFTEYVGSFPVKETDSRRRVWIIEEQMRFLKDCPRRRAVILKFCLQGVKMYDADGETLLMAHALGRIQYTTCRPEDHQFAFVSRNPHRPASQLYCHLFVASQPSEAQVLNLLLSRAFQLRYWAQHPEGQDCSCNPAHAQRKGSNGRVVREPLDPDEVSQNVNALVSFRRVSVAKEEEEDEEVTNGEDETSGGYSMSRTSSVESPYSSPVLVRKKAIRSKIIRCGAYRFPYCGAHHPPLQELITSGPEKNIPEKPELSEKPEVLQDGVWFCAGINRDTSLALLKEDRLGAFVLHADPASCSNFTLYMNTQCGVIPYRIYAKPRSGYCFEHLPQEFPSLASLVEHHSGSDGSLFFQLAHGRVNPCYEAQDPQNGPDSPRETLQKPHPEELTQRHSPLTEDAIRRDV